MSFASCELRCAAGFAAAALAAFPVALPPSSPLAAGAASFLPLAAASAGLAA